MQAKKEAEDYFAWLDIHNTNGTQNRDLHDIYRARE